MSRPDEAVDQRDAIRHEHPGRVARVQPEPTGAVGVHGQEPAGRDAGAARDGQGAGVVVVLEDEAAHVGRRPAGVHQSDEVGEAFGLDLVDFDARQRIARPGGRTEHQTQRGDRRDGQERGQAGAIRWRSTRATPSSRWQPSLPSEPSITTAGRHEQVVSAAAAPLLGILGHGASTPEGAANGQHSDRRCAAQRLLGERPEPSGRRRVVAGGIDVEQLRRPAQLTEA